MCNRLVLIITIAHKQTHIDTKSAKDRSPLPGVSVSEGPVSFRERHLPVPPHRDLWPLLTPLDPRNLKPGQNSDLSASCFNPGLRLRHTWTEYLSGTRPLLGLAGESTNYRWMEVTPTVFCRWGDRQKWDQDSERIIVKNKKIKIHNNNNNKWKKAVFDADRRKYHILMKIYNTFV